MIIKENHYYKYRNSKRIIKIKKIINNTNLEVELVFDSKVNLDFSQNQKFHINTAILNGFYDLAAYCINPLWKKINE